MASSNAGLSTGADFDAQGVKRRKLPVFKENDQIIFKTDEEDTKKEQSKQVGARQKQKSKYTEHFPLIGMCG